MSLRAELRRIASEHPETRKHLLPLLKQAGGYSWLGRTLMKAEKDLTRMAQKYTGETDHTKASVKETSSGVVIRIWLQLEDYSDRFDVQEITDILVGKGGKVEPHKLVPYLWVVTKIV